MARLFVEQLCAMDFARLDGQRGLVGDTWILDVELEGNLDEQGMVLDFGQVKPTIKAAVDATADHRLIVPGRHPGLRADSADGEIRLEFAYDDRVLFHRSPADAVCLIDAESVTPNAVARHLQHTILPILPGNVTGLRLGLREETISGPWYRYAHGLRQHQGNCQRIAHGHRSRIEILRNGKRCEASERWLADRWRDAYLGCREDLASELQRDGVRYYVFRYRAPQGEFELTIDADRCELLDSESTVECISEHILRLLKAREPNESFRVRAYEGINKGAMSEG